MSKKNYILEKINQLCKLIEKNYENDDENFFPPNYIEVLKTKETIEIHNSADIEMLKIMNLIWKKHKKIQIIQKETGKLPKDIDKIFVNEIVDILKNEIKRPKLKAIKFVRENQIDKDGSIFTLEKAKFFVEQIIEEYQI